MQYLNKATGALRMTGGNILDYAGTTENLTDCASRFMDYVYSEDLKKLKKLQKSLRMGKR